MENNEIIEVEKTVGDEIRGASQRGGVVIGTLNIMTEPARGFITKPLQTLYESRYHGKFKNPKHRFAFDLALAGIIIALAVVALYFGIFYKPYDPINVTLTITPKQLIAGGEAVARLRIENNSEYTLDDVTVAINIPPNVSVKSISLPWDAEEKLIRYGTIEPGAIVDARIIGSISGAVGTSHRASVIVSYTERERDRKVKKSVVANLKIERSALTLSFELPETIVSGQLMSGTLRYRNAGNDPILNVVLTPVWPEGFVFTNSTPALRKDGWLVGAVRAGAEGTVRWEGAYTHPQGADEPIFHVQSNVRDDDELLRQGDAEEMVKVIDTRISLQLRETTLSARVGETLTMTANYKNNGSFVAHDANITIIAESGLTAEIDNARVIDELEPGESGSAKITVRIASPLPDDLAQTKNIALHLRVQLNFSLTDPEIKNAAISSAPMEVRIAPMLDLIGIARYWSESGDQLGRGPLPPKVGQPTRYWIFWSVRNTTSTVKGVRVSAILPANVSWTGKASIPYGDPLVFDPGTRTLTWNVGEVPPFPGTASPAISAAYEVALIPTPDQAGTSPLLVTSQKVNGRDSFTELTVSGTAPQITTNLTSDPKAVGKGKVQ